MDRADELPVGGADDDPCPGLVAGPYGKPSLGQGGSKGLGTVGPLPGVADRCPGLREADAGPLGVLVPV